MSKCSGWASFWKYSAKMCGGSATQDFMSTNVHLNGVNVLPFSHLVTHKTSVCHSGYGALDQHYKHLFHILLRPGIFRHSDIGFDFYFFFSQALVINCHFINQTVEGKRNKKRCIKACEAFIHFPFLSFLQAYNLHKCFRSTECAERIFSMSDRVFPDFTGVSHYSL